MKVTRKKMEKKVPAKGRALTRQKKDHPGWRRLRVGETIVQEDWALDKRLTFKSGGGIPTACAGSKVATSDGNYYYRRIKVKAPARKASRKGAK